MEPSSFEGGGPEDPGVARDDLDERAFYTELRANHARVVPVVGSGLSVDAGAPGFDALVHHLVTRASRVNGPSDLAVDDWWGTIDKLASVLGDDWVRDTSAALFACSPVAATPALRALCKVRSGLIVTTNYDVAIEVSAQAIGRPVRSLTLADFDAALAEPDETLRVLHLHGLCTEPSSIVLTNVSYEAILADERVELTLRDLGIRFQLVFLGQRLEAREAHIRRDLAWTLAATSANARRCHLLITNQVSVSDPPAIAFRAELERTVGIQVVQFDDPEREHKASVRAAHVLAGPSAVEAAKQAPVISEEEFDIHYLALDVAPVREVEDAGDRASYRAVHWQSPDVRSTDLDSSVSCLILEAEGGAGKSQELLQVARRSASPALLQHLSRFDVRTLWADAGQRFVSGMSDARAARTGVAKLTHDALRDDSYAFVLDGLDEVPAPSREAVIRLVGDVAAKYPQHRYVIGSRPLPVLAGHDIFERWMPLTDMRWVNEYAQNRGLSPEDLAVALPDSGDIDDLIQIPIYAAAAVDRVTAGNPLPQTAIELICDLADEHLIVDSRIEAEPEQIRIWLDRMALAMMLAGVNELTLDELVATRLHEGLGRLSPDEDTLGELVARAILRDANGMFRFPANVMREARAARALLEAESVGRAVLASHVLVELDVFDDHGNPVRGVHPSWVGLLELLLPAADSTWHEAVAYFDPVLEARTTASSGSSEARMRAVVTIWETYVSRRVWIERSTTGGAGDGEALIRLLKAGPNDEVRKMLLDSLTDSERTVRGNAVELVPFVLPPDDLWQRLTEHVRDSDAVVRRHAAAAAFWILREHPDLPEDDPMRVAFVDAMEAQVHIDDDQGACEALAGSAVDLATEARAVEIALGSPSRVRKRAIMHLAQRLTRSDLLQLLADQMPFDSDLFEELQDRRRFGAREPWEPHQVATLTHVIVEHSDDSYWRHEAIDLLVDDRPAALVALSCHPVDQQGEDSLDRRLIVRMSESELNRSVLLLRDQPTNLLAEVGVGPDAWLLDEGATRSALELLDAVLHRVRSQPSADVDNEEPKGQNRPAAKSLEEAAIAKTDDELRTVFDNDGVATAFNPERRSAPMNVTYDLTEAAKRNLPLSAPECLQLFRFLLDWTERELEPWLSRNWNPAVGELAASLFAGLSPSQLSRLVDLIPGPWTEDMGELVLTALAASDQRAGGRASAALTVVENVGESFFRNRAETTKAMADQMWVDIVLVRLGDCAAEARMVERLSADPRKISRSAHAFDEEWVSSVRCPETTDSIAVLIRRAHMEGVEQFDLGPLSRALDRTAGLRALSIWEELAGDPDIPSASFLFYQWREARDSLVVAKVGLRDITDPELSDLVHQTVTGRSI